MKLSDLKLYLKENSLFYCIGFIILFLLKWFYSKADANALLFILAPTSHLVSLFSGVPFFWEPHMGYTNHSIRFIIASSCSGLQFLLVTVAIMLFSFIHRFSSGKNKSCWFLFSFIFSYCFTVFTNSIRITLSLYLPIWLARSYYINTLLTSEELHTLTGTVVYFSSLFPFYKLTDYLSMKLSTKRHICHSLYAWIFPVFWYFSIVLGIPLLTGIYRNGQFSNEYLCYAKFTLSICFAVLLTFISIRFIKNFLMEKYKSKHS